MTYNPPGNCACLQVAYTPKPHHRIGLEEHWSCKSCGGEFVRQGRLEWQADELDKLKDELAESKDSVRQHGQDAADLAVQLGAEQARTSDLRTKLGAAIRELSS